MQQTVGFLFLHAIVRFSYQSSSISYFLPFPFSSFISLIFSSSFPPSCQKYVEPRIEGGFAASLKQNKGRDNSWADSLGTRIHTPCEYAICSDISCLKIWRLFITPFRFSPMRQKLCLLTIWPFSLFEVNTCHLFRFQVRLLDWKGLCCHCLECRMIYIGRLFHTYSIHSCGVNNIHIRYNVIWYRAKGLHSRECFLPCSW